MNQNWVWVAIPIAAILAGVLRTWIRARHGYPLDSHGGRRRRGPGDGAGHGSEPFRPNEIGDLKAAVAARDALIAKLEERVRVLERIATDNPAALRDEIERLRT
jgi:hypothetical protein